jgi:putative ABC transport system permease protein
VGVRYTTDSAPSTSTAGWSTADLWALPNFDSIKVQKLTLDQATSWPPGPGEVVLEKSVLQVQRFSIGDTITVETENKDRSDLRVVGFAHDINAVPTKFSDTVVGYISMGTLGALKEPDKFNYLALSLDPAFSQAAASRVAVNVRDRELASANVRTLRMTVPKPGSHFLGDIFKALSLLLLAMGVLSLALSGLLVVTTVSAIMAQQIKQIGIMKAVGGRV